MRIEVGKLGQEILAEVGVYAAADRRAVTVGHNVKDLLAVERIAQRLAHRFVRKRLVGVVEIHGLHEVHGALENVKALGELVCLRGGQVGADVHRAALERHDERLGILINLIGDLVHLRALAPVIGEALQHKILLRGAGDKLERTGTDRVRAVGVVLRCDGQRHVGEEIAVGSLEHNGDIIAADVDGVNVIQRLPVTGLHSLVDRPCDIHCRDLAAVVELHTGAEMERISELIVGDLPALGDGGDQVAVRVGLDEPLKHVEQHLAVRGGDGGIGVKAVFQVLRDADDDLVRVAPRVGRVGVPAAGGEGEQQGQGKEQGEDALIHGILLLVL